MSVIVAALGVLVMAARRPVRLAAAKTESEPEVEAEVAEAEAA